MFYTHVGMQHLRVTEDGSYEDDRVVEVGDCRRDACLTELLQCEALHLPWYMAITT